MVMKAIEPSCHLMRGSLHVFFWWLFCSQSFSMSAAYCKCVVKDFVFGCQWERCMKIFNFEKVGVLPKRGLSTRPKWSWKLLSRVVTSRRAVYICRASRFFDDCFVVRVFPCLLPLASVLWKISFWVVRDVWNFEFCQSFRSNQKGV